MRRLRVTKGPDPVDEARSVSPAPVVPPLPWRQAHHAGRRRSAGAGLDRGRIVDAGLRIVDAEGVEALSLRRLATDLGVTPMAVYWHVEDKAELLELIGERVLETIEVPSAAGDWQRQLRDVHLAMLGPLLEHPNAVELMIGRARFGPAGISLFERILSILLEAGLSAEAAFDAYQSLYLFQLGFTATSRRSPEFIEGQRQGAMYLRSLDADRFPAIAAVAPVIGARPLVEAYEVGLDIVIEGIAIRLARGR
jgi:TetR/AcrR family tetracycline transcriptional repressor